MDTLKIFVDVGAHEGQTIEEVVKPEWGFDIIFALEPMPNQFKTLQRMFLDDPRVKAYNIGLGSNTGRTFMYGSNQKLEASLFPHKNDVDENMVTSVEIMDAAAYFDSLPEGDIFCNMNCEGAELPILTRLLDTGTIQRINSLLVDFDIRKVPGLELEEEDLRTGLDMSGITWTSEYPLPRPDVSHQEQIALWLHGVLVAS